MDENKGLSYFFMGLGIGVAVGMIFAPQAGAETRTQIRNRAAEGGDYVRRRGTQLRDSAGELVDRGKTMVARQRENLTGAMEAGRQAYRDTVQGADEEQAAANEITTPAQGI